MFWTFLFLRSFMVMKYINQKNKGDAKTHFLLTRNAFYFHLYKFYIDYVHIYFICDFGHFLFSKNVQFSEN